MNKQNKGFTLIEILIVIGIIAILAAVVLIAINPARQFAQANNSQRSSNVNTLLNAVGQKLADTKGLLSGCASMTPSTVYTIADRTPDLVDELDLAECLYPTYIAAGLPFDPTDADAGWTDKDNYNTGYTISTDGSRYTVSAPSTQLTPDVPVITVTR
ncbi:MAG: prepilin-type N-terminal cleavage/methylation domain-containing protein [bacterium]|nr:prepilin-type N-terminal cleavage/methylation domain-containing protein [bacterium]